MKRKKLTGSLVYFALLLFATVAWAAPVPDTGQTRCYNNTDEISCPSPGQPFYGQDGSFTINPMSYTKLDAGGNALPDSAKSWVMVRDNVTGLIWEVKTNKDGVKNYNDPHDADNKYTWYDSNPATNGGNAGTPGNGTDTNDFIKALNDAKYGSYSDWRMPTIKELINIVNYSIPDPGPTINLGYFPNTQEEYSFYWSSTTDASSIPTWGYSIAAWGVYFEFGSNNDVVKTGNCFVRAVRGGQSQPAYVDNGNGTVTDTSTGLMWQQADSSNTMNWEQALTYCEGMNLGEYTDWRLPTIRELLSIADYSRDNPTINTTYFPDTVSFLNSSKNPSFYWSSTTDAEAYATSFARCMSYYNGLDFSSPKSYNGYVRAVRGGKAVSLCTAILNGNLSLHIPYLSNVNPTSGILSLWAEFIYDFYPAYPTIIPFKLTNAVGINNPYYSCAASTFSSDLKIHIPDVLLPDNITHIRLDLEYSPVLSTDGNFYWVVSNYGVVSN